LLIPVSQTADFFIISFNFKHKKSPPVFGELLYIFISDIEIQGYLFRFMEKEIRHHQFLFRFEFFIALFLINTKKEIII